MYSGFPVDEFRISREHAAMNSSSIYARYITPRVIEAMQDTPVVMLAGPRQSGKTTLVRQLAQAQGLRYLTLDDQLTLLSAREDPVGFVRSLDRAVIDEVQRASALLLAIKQTVDEDRRPGRFLLTGSANLMALPTMADSLAGRMESLTLLPLSQREVVASETNWIDSVFAGRLPVARHPVVAEALVDVVLRGGYPEARARATARRRVAWCRQYVDALIQRDVRDIASINRLADLPRFLRGLAQSAGQLCNYTQLGAALGLDGKTAARYVSVFEQMYLLTRVDVWARNHLSRVVKTPKLQFLDAGLLSAVLETSADELSRDRMRFGALLETFVFSELLKHATVASRDYQLLHYRDVDKVEVDIVIEDAAGQVVGIEVKAAATVQASDLRGLTKLASLAGEQFKLGVVLYDGSETLPLGDRLWAMPVSSLWGEAAE